MTHAIALTLPPCAECGMPTSYRTVAGLLKCTSGICDWFVHVEPQGTVARPEPLMSRPFAGLLTGWRR